jgi:protein-S-isoprenylcysteine O-methyltransferase Ste14
MPVTAVEPRFPAAFEAADSFSLEGQRKTLRGTSARLILTVLATLCLSIGPLWPTEIGEHHEIEIVGIVAAALFLVAFLYEVWLLRLKPESEWYDGRAVAESTKTLSWRYAVGGKPYPIGEDADEAFELDIKALGTDVGALQGAVATGGSPTAWMRSLRSTDLETRRSSYIEGRVRDQEAWYARKARHNLRRARMWSLTLLVAEALGVVLALLKALSFVTIDLASLAAAVIASGAAWLAVKQHESIGAAYTIASLELASVHVRLLSVDDESQWAEEVASAEEAVSREHTMWRASRTKSDVTKG